MPSPDDFSVQIPVTSDIDPMLRELDAAIVQAQQKGQEAGQAYAHGMALGAAGGGVGGGINGPGIGGGGGGGISGTGLGSGGDFHHQMPFNGGINGNIAAASAAGAAAGGGGGLNTGAINGAAVGVAINQGIAVAERFEAVGEKLGGWLAETTKQQLELTQAIRQNTQAIAAAQATSRAALSSQGGGVGGRPVSSAMQDRLQDLETENAGLDERLATYGFTDLLEDAGRYGLALPTLGATLKTKTTRMQVREQRDDNQAAIESLRKQQSGLIQAGRLRSMGAGIADVADEMGIPFNPTLRQTGDTMSPVAFEAFKQSIRGNSRAVSDLAQSFNSWSGQQSLVQRTVQTQQSVR